jgi:ABC-type multidrug transport system fused ATPase/permease subunit
MKLLAILWRLLDPRQRRAFLLLHATALSMAFSTLIGIAAVVPFLIALQRPAIIQQHERLSRWLAMLPTADERLLTLTLGSAFAVTIVLANAINWAGSTAMHNFAYRTGFRASVALFDDYLERGVAFHGAANRAALFGAVMWETNRGVTGVLQATFLMTTALATIALIVASLALLDPLVALAATAGIGTCYAAMYLAARSRLQRLGSLESTLAEDRARTANEALAGIKDILASQTQHDFRARFERATLALCDVVTSRRTMAQTPRYVLECLAVIGLVGTALLLTRSAEHGAWLAQLSFLGLAAYRLLPALQQLYQAIVQLRADRVPLFRLAPDLRRALRSSAESRRHHLEVAWRPQRDICLQSVSFRYRDDLEPVLRDVSLQIRVGGIHGFTGPSGAGKTTTADLIAGLLTPTSGYVEVDGVAIGAHNLSRWQSAVAYVPQDPCIFDASIATNVALGATRADIDREHVFEAARAARLDAMIETFPNGYDEMVGASGTRLSGGQRQRLSIARAIYLDRPVLIMDEATNELDGPTQEEILALLAQWRGRRTVIVISHRPEVLQQCDVVLRFEAGSVVCDRDFDDRAGASRSRGYRAAARV